MSNQKETQERIDAVLDAALDDLDDDESDDNGCVVQNGASPLTNQEKESLTKPNDKSTRSPSHQGPSFPIPQGDMNEMEGMDKIMQELLRLGEGQNQNGTDDPDEFIGRLLQGVQSQFDAELKKGRNTTTTEKDSPRKLQSPIKSAQSLPANGENEIDQAIASMINGMAEHANLGTENCLPGSEDEYFKSEMDQLGDGMGTDVNADALIDGMMEQLLSKDLMYEPMKKVSEKFPQWLKDNKATLPESEYKRRYKQAQYFRKLVTAYETEPGNIQSLMTLMQEVQEFGQPPPEIIRDIAPGLELDADGLPKMNGFGGMPMASADEDCRIM